MTHGIILEAGLRTGIKETKRGEYCSNKQNIAVTQPVMGVRRHHILDGLGNWNYRIGYE